MLGICRNFSGKYPESTLFRQLIHRNYDQTMEEPVQMATYEDVNGPIEVTVIQLLPDFDGCFDDSSADLATDDIVSYTSEELNDLQTEVNMDDDNCCSNQFLQDPFLLPSLGISPAVVQRIRSDSLGKSDYLSRMHHSESESETESCVPVLLGRSSPRLSISLDGFITLKDYKISPDTLGGGKLSEVRLAYSEKDGVQYAVKIHSKRRLQNYNMLLRTSRNPIEEAYREIEILRRLEHPNIIKLVDVVDDEDDDNLYLVFERLDRELMTIPSDTPFNEHDAQKVFKDILSGVQYLHNNNIVHRDLKPENMLIDREGAVKIADFGSCDELIISPVPGNEPISSCCSSGTPAFTPPECLGSCNKPVAGCKLDMWSLGVTLYALVVGDVPFKGENMIMLHKSIKKEQLTFPSHIYLSDALKDLISRLLTKDPAERLKMEEVWKHRWICDPVGGRIMVSVGSFVGLSDDF